MNLFNINRFFNLHKGERLILICNGPSLKNENFELIKGEIKFGMNKIFLGFKDLKIYPDYYIAINKLVVEQSISQIDDLNCTCFLPENSRYLIQNKPMRYFISSVTNRDFCFDISRGVNEGFTVTYAALQIAYYMGFKQVLIIGMDHKYTFQGEPNDLSFCKGLDKNHFNSSYFQNSNWNNPDLKKSEYFYSISKEVYEKDDREIIDCTKGGSCTIFRKSKLNNFL